MARLLLNETSNDRAFTLFNNIHIRRRNTMKTILNSMDRLMMAITFAEANEPETAQECLSGRKTAENKRGDLTPRMTGSQILPSQATH